MEDLKKKMSADMNDKEIGKILSVILLLIQQSPKRKASKFVL